MDTAEDEERVERVQELCSALLLSDEQLQHIGRDTLCVVATYITDIGQKLSKMIKIRKKIFKKIIKK